MTTIRIKDVTLLAVSSIRIPETIQALKTSSLSIQFGNVKLVSHERPKELPDWIDFGYCPRIENINQFNQYVFKDLTEHVSTTHCLMVQDHAYVINYYLWNDFWLNYDYIGAPWPIIENTYIADNGERVRVGNGGFSLRSKKILDAPRKLGLNLKHVRGWYNEDGNLCCYHRQALLQYGIKYAPVEVAAKFSYENSVEENKDIIPFGFHRNKPKQLNNNYFWRFDE